MIDNKTRIHIHELRIGMFVSELDIPWSKSPFDEHNSGFIIQSREELAKLRDCCTYIYIDVEKQKRQYGAIPTKLTKATDKVAFKQAFGKAT